ncbi:MAG: M4 family metallopeptidase, partial [Bacteroidia bacterium]
MSGEKALDAAVNYIGAKSYKWQMPEEEEHLKKEQNDPSATYYPKAELCYYKPLKGAYVLAYRLDIYAHEPVSRQYVFIDAQNGNILGEEERIVHTDQPGSAITGYSGTQPIVADFTGTTYRLRETGRGNGIETFNLQKGTSYAASVDFTDSDNVWNLANANKDQYATDAHFGAEKTYDYFFSKFNRNSIDGNGFKLISYVHYSTNYVNAFWDGSRMTYGDGNTTYNPLTSMDIAGHEITHGLTNFSANLVYSYESGALNESFSDIFGTAIEYYATPSLGDWLVGEDIGAAFRSMSNPNAYSQPDTYLGSYWYTGSGDNGGVHYNSGVQNFWFYLLSVGGTGTNDIGNAYNVPSIGIDKAAAIAFRTLTVYLGPNSQYADARFYSIKAAEDLYGVCSAEAQAVAHAWYAVGVGANTITLTPTISLNGSSSFCAGNSVTLIGNALPNYQWRLNGNPISGATASSYTTGVAGVYTLSANACGTTSTSSPVTLVSNSATAVISANELSSCSAITLNASTSPGYALQWMLNGSDIPGATASSYSATSSGNYSLRIQSTIGPAQTLNNTTAVSIPDNSCPGATSSIVTSGLPSAINPAGISVRINVTHTYNGDLRLWLEAPNGDLLGLASGVGGSGDNFTNTVFSDAGSAQIPATGAPYTGTYKPWQSSFTQCSATMNKTSFA